MADDGLEHELNIKLAMKNITIVSLFLFACLYLQGQVSFEKGYLLNNNGERVECFIKNVNSKNTPQVFFYKLKAHDVNEKIAELKNFKEVGIGDKLKYVKRVVQMDQSLNSLEQISEQRAAEFIEDTVFLEVLLEGEASLFYYQGRRFNRFFFEKGALGIQPLVYKMYSIDGKVGENKQYLQQINNHLVCDGFERVDQLLYNKKRMTLHFAKYNECMDTGYTNYMGEEKSGEFKLWARLELMNGRLNLSDYNGKEFDEVSFGRHLNLQYGVSLEYILPYGNGTWSLLAEPSIQTVNAQRGLWSVEHISIELPVGGRYYIFSKDKQDQAKLYLSLQYLLDIFAHTEVFIGEQRIRDNNLVIGDFAFGFGGVYNRFEAGIRVKLSKNMLGDYYISDSELNYGGVSLGLSYNIF
jgi:hypothetical protein